MGTECEQGTDLLKIANAVHTSRGLRPTWCIVHQDPQFECSKIEVCTSKDCRRKGSVKTLAYFQALAADQPVEIIETDECWWGTSSRVNKDTTFGSYNALRKILLKSQLFELMCRYECTSGPNIRLDENDSRIFGAISSEAKVAEVLGVSVPEW